MNRYGLEQHGIMRHGNAHWNLVAPLPVWSGLFDSQHAAIVRGLTGAEVSGNFS